MGRIYGYIYDYKTNQPVVGAMVTYHPPHGAPDSQKQTVTDSTGYYSFNNVFEDRGGGVGGNITATTIAGGHAISSPPVHHTPLRVNLQMIPKDLQVVNVGIWGKPFSHAGELKVYLEKNPQYSIDIKDAIALKPYIFTYPKSIHGAVIFEHNGKIKRTSTYELDQEAPDGIYTPNFDDIPPRATAHTTANKPSTYSQSGNSSSTSSKLPWIIGITIIVAFVFFRR